MKRPLITAHSGCMNTAENSIASVVEGARAGAEIIEVDVRATRDGVVVLLHDEEVPTPYGIRPVQDLTFEELMRLKGEAKEESVTRLEDVLPLIREYNRIINLDLKEYHAVDPMLRTVEKFNMRDYALITGCEKEKAASIKERYRPYQVLLNASARTYEAAGGDYEAFVQETCRDAVSASCCGINIHYRYCLDALLDYAGMRCLPVLVWTVDDASAMRHFLEKGVHSITTHEVKTLADLRGGADPCGLFCVGGSLSVGGR